MTQGVRGLATRSKRTAKSSSAKVALAQPNPLAAARAPRRLTIDAPNSVHLERFQPAERLPAGSVRVRVSLAGICGSDLHVLAGHHPFVSYPVLPGHELVGVVVAAGDEANRYLLGQRVTVEPSLYCGECRACRRGDYNICEHLRVMGFQAPGGMADSFDVPAHRLHQLPQSLTDEHAVLAEPLSVAVRAVRLAQVRDGDEVAVIGAGTIGLLCAHVARARGASVVLAEKDDTRRQLAGTFQFDVVPQLRSNSADVVLECVGAEPALRAGVEAVRKGGTVAVVGVHGRDARLQVGLVQDRELRLIGVLMYRAEDFRESIEHLARGAVEADRIIGGRFALEDFRDAFGLAATGGEILKVVIEP